MDVDARIQVFDLKTKYQFQTTPCVDQYNMPLYDIQVEGSGSGTQSINFFPVYQGFIGPAYVNGIEVPFFTQRENFFNTWPNVVQFQQVVGTGNGSSGPYTLQFPIISNTSSQNPPLNGILRGHIDITGIISTGANQDPPLVTDLNLNVPVTSVDSKVFITSIDSTGANVIVQDSGQFLSGNVNYGLLMQPGNAPFGNAALPNNYTNSFSITGATQATQCVLTCTSNFQVGQSILVSGVTGMTELNGNTYIVVSVSPTTVTLNVDSTGFTAYVSGGTASSITNVVNYLTGTITNLFFPVAIPDGQNITAQCFYFQSGLPRGVLFYNNTLTFRSPPAFQYLVELDAYLTPAAFLTTSQAVPFGYMSEYIARGAARKILADTGDVEQFQFYEQFFREQELLVWKRSQRQWTSTRTQTIYSQGNSMVGNGMYNNSGSIY
jgi:hypothetical protein